MGEKDIMTEVVITGAARTPVGSFLGSLSSMAASELGAIAITEALSRAGVSPEDVSEVIMGQILSAGGGQNPARQAAIGAGIPNEKTAYGINQLCGSGLRTVALGYQAILAGDSDVVVAGGLESMSQSPHVMHLRNGVKMGSGQMVDTMINDGLMDAFNGYHMGTTAENVARKWQLTRDEQDAFALGSQNKAEAAQKAGKFKDEIVPVTIKSRKGDTVVDADEYPKHGTTIESLTKLRPAFDKEGTVIFTTRTGLSIHKEAIEVLHLIGAQDSYIAGQFAARAMMLGLKGGLIGMALGLPALYLVGSLAESLEEAALPDLSFGPIEWAIFAIIPLCVAGLAMTTARSTVLRSLARML